jgi:serine/threonine-protein kinase HipA
VKFEHVDQVAVFYEPEPDRRRKVGRLALRQRQILFEYDPGFLGSKLELSPFHLRLTPDVVVGRPAVFDGLMGVFDDSLPDGWGRLLIDRRAAELGMSGSSLTPLDRLTVVGARSMGALVYEPEIGLEDPALVKLSELANQADLVMRNASGADLERLIAIGGSPQGARPKVLIQLAPNGDVHFGAKTIQPGFTAWLVKFPAREDDPHSAPLEHAYFLLVAGEGRAPGVAHLTALAAQVDLKHGAKIIEEVRAVIGRFKRFADKAGVPARLRDRTAQALAASKR